ncbi:hypothetical protein AB0M43_36105 [Longispora sp. NPDC051575]|uniref:hypothetical protein n=1 Tax=Longispora sp. NPDC051575 TaxID=3154943 RepID=UPI0034383826
MTQLVQLSALRSVGDELPDGFDEPSEWLIYSGLALVAVAVIIAVSHFWRRR